jgi:hypothetical protein
MGLIMERFHLTYAQLDNIATEVDAALGELSSVKSQLDVITIQLNSIQVLLDTIIADDDCDEHHDVVDAGSDTNITDDVIVPDGYRLCGQCSGCGEYHFLWDGGHHDHTHDDECDHYDHEHHNHIHDDDCDHD